MRKSLLVLSFFAAVSLCGCVPDPEVIKDLTALRQDTLAYLDTAPSASVETPVASKDHAELLIAHYEKKPGFGENKQPRDAAWIASIKDNADLAAFPNADRKAITLKNTSLRLLPTAKPIFNDFSLAGEGYPFDTLQNSVLPPDMIVSVEHLSKDKAWAWVSSPIAGGWLSIQDIAWLSSDQATACELAASAALTTENVSFVDENGQFLTKGNIGMRMPLAGQTTENIQVKIAVANENRDAVFKTVTISKTDAIASPLALNAQNVATMANKMISQPYGWGGLYENRDCSAMIQDLFVPFGIDLPRNSGSWFSAKVGRAIRLSGLSADDREKIILQNGVPFLTVLWMKGHVMLYIGKKDGKALVFHNIWGLRTKEADGKEGRKIIGKAVITTLQPGKELSSVDPSAELLGRIEGMTLLR